MQRPGSSQTKLRKERSGTTSSMHPNGIHEDRREPCLHDERTALTHHLQISAEENACDSEAWPERNEKNRMGQKEQTGQRGQRMRKKFQILCPICPTCPLCPLRNFPHPALATHHVNS